VRRYLGIDPGVSGAFAVLHLLDTGDQALTVHPIPCDWIEVGGGKRRRYNLFALHKALVHTTPISLAYLELQSARPGQGVVSMFSTGFGFGVWQGLLTAIGIPYMLVAPQRWRSRVGLPAGGKKKAIKRGVCLAACRRFPGMAIPLEHSDAVMIAVAAALEHGNGGG